MRQIEGLGKVSCSRLVAVMGSPTAWISYREDIRKEWVLLGDPYAEAKMRAIDDSFVPRPIRHGRDTEERALAEFLLRHPELDTVFIEPAPLSGAQVSVPSLANTTVLMHPRHPWFCGTPDIRFADEQLPMSGVKTGAEVKCPVNEDRHVRKNQPLPTRYYDQIQGYIELTGSEGWWFVSYYLVDLYKTDNPYPQETVSALYTERWIPRHDAYIIKMMARAEMFWAYVVQDDAEAIDDYYPQAQALGDLSALFR